MLIGCIAPLTAFAADPTAVTLHACDAASGFTAKSASLSAANGKLKIAMQNGSAVIGKDVPLNTLRPGTGVISFDLSPADAVTGGEVRIFDTNGRKATYAFSSANCKTADSTLSSATRPHVKTVSLSVTPPATRSS